MNRRDLSNLVISHLLGEGYAETEKSAEVILHNMSEDWMHQIISEAMSADERREMRRLAAQERRGGDSGRMSSSVASKYADSEGRSAERADKKSRGKHIHGTVDEGTMDIKHWEIPQNERDAAAKRTRAKSKAAREKSKKVEEQALSERQLDPTETSEKERIVKGMKKSAAGFKQRYGDRWKSVMYATATKQAKDNMDTSRSDRRYSVER